MLKAIRNIGALTLLIANIKLIARLAIIFMLFLTIEIVYSKWQDPSLSLSESFRNIILYIYTIVQLSLVFYFVFGLRNFVWVEKEKKVIQAKESFNNMPTDYKGILDIDKYPKLK